MNDIYLRAEDALELYTYLESAGVIVRDEDGPVVSDPYKFALDVIGTIWKATGEPIYGYHANLRVLCDFDAEPLAGITINTPHNPVRGWA
jgi:hypothetical protein